MSKSPSQFSSLFENKVRLYLEILSVLTIISGVISIFIFNLRNPSTTLSYLAIFYMPIPFFSLLILGWITKEKINLGQYGSLRQINLKEILFVIMSFLLWILIFTTLNYFFGKLNTDLFGKLILDSNEMKENLIRIYGEQISGSINSTPNVFVILISTFIGSIIAGFTINLLFALGEEYGWRGFLAKNIPGKFIVKYLIIGSIWGLWHSPLILQGYNYGPGYPLSGTFMFILFCIGFGYLFGVIRESFDNVIYAGMLHGMFNGFVGIYALLLTEHNPLFGGPVGIISAFSFIITSILAYNLSKLMFKNNLNIH